MNKRWFRYLPLIIGSAIILLFIVGMVVFFNSLFEEEPVKKKIVQQVTIIAPPPPPPPPPEDQPEPEIEEEEIIEEEFEDAMPDEGSDDSVGDDLGLDAEGGAGGDSFGLVGRKGGRGILGGGYAGLVQQTITDLLTDDGELKSKEYVVIVELWISPGGELEKYEISQRSGDEKAKELFEFALLRLNRFSKAPPLEMPQPIRLRIKSRL